MLTWIITHAATILISIAVLGIVLIIVADMVKKKKMGKTSCGCGCSSCPMGEVCHHDP